MSVDLSTMTSLATPSFCSQLQEHANCHMLQSAWISSTAVVPELLVSACLLCKTCTSRRMCTTQHRPSFLQSQMKSESTNSDCNKHHKIPSAMASHSIEHSLHPDYTAQSVHHLHHLCTCSLCYTSFAIITETC
jgi:hypothetical protein